MSRRQAGADDGGSERPLEISRRRQIAIVQSCARGVHHVEFKAFTMSAAVSAAMASAISSSSSGGSSSRRWRRSRAGGATAAATLRTGVRGSFPQEQQQWPPPTTSAACAASSSASFSLSRGRRSRRWSLRCRANAKGSGFDDATRDEYRKMGVGADEDEFGEPPPEAFRDGEDGRGFASSSRDGVGVEEDEAEDEERRVFRDVSVEQNNDIVSRFANLLKYILVIRLGTELPMRHFDVPSDAGVGGNVFSQFISSIVPLVRGGGTG